MISVDSPPVGASLAAMVGLVTVAGPIVCMHERRSNLLDSNNLRGAAKFAVSLSHEELHSYHLHRLVHMLSFMVAT
ncbi:unnamed protein product [Sphenostylis stenocarpa]|uniref:Uncharacterized protein n=1 Tax=Sphenostylis stenocarpa TaxID=92480 RepID=A0AA86VX33_9FABA|nr:unnamed protein product [Sphenostylis stenocarpa]